MEEEKKETFSTNNNNNEENDDGRKDKDNKDGIEEEELYEVVIERNVEMKTSDGITLVNRPKRYIYILTFFIFIIFNTIASTLSNSLLLFLKKNHPLL